MALPLFWAAAAFAAVAGGAAAILNKNNIKSSKSDKVTRAQSQNNTTSQDFLDDIYDAEDDYVPYEQPKVTRAQSQNIATNQDCFVDIDDIDDYLPTDESRAALERIRKAQSEIYEACNAEKMRQIKEDAQKRKKEKVDAQEETSSGVEADRFKAGRLKRILKPLREAAGFTAEEFAERLDLSRQAVANLENSSTKLNVSQYWAIMAFLTFQEGPHCLISRSTFVIIVDCLIENPNKYTDQARREIENNLRLLGTATKTAIKQSDKSGMKEMADHFAEAIARISNEGHI